MSSQKSALPMQATTAQQNTPRKVSLDLDPYAAPAEYYGKSHGPRKVAKSRTYSAHDPMKESSPGYKKPGRRLSHDAQGNAPRRYQINVNETRAALLKSEDTDDNEQITIDDHGPKTINLRTAASGGHHQFDIRGTYMLSNLLQELTLAKAFGLKEIVLDEARLNENPVSRMSRLIKDVFWKNLTRRIDGSNIMTVAKDTKVLGTDPRPRIYVPRGAPEQYEYYQRISEKQREQNLPRDQTLEVLYLAETPSKDDYVRDLNIKPGLLAIEMERKEDTADGKPDFRGLPFIVPGGRFNELYGWDSYMETLGLLVNDKVDLCENMVRHFCFSIKHYGKILNANRSYYLCRSQPPFLTDMALRVYDRMKHRPDSLEFLRTAFLAAIKDYYGTWTSEPRIDKESGLSCYRPGGLGVPPETEATHFKDLLTPYAEKHHMGFDEFIHAYNYRSVLEPKLDEYFRHDRAVRESGHDTSYRLEGKAADLATVDLNSCLYKIEVDIARVIRNFFGDKLMVPPEWRANGVAAFETSAIWDRRAKKRRQQMEKLMWDEEKGMFFDYFVTEGKHTEYESATTFWAMWAGAATPRQAQIMVNKALPLFEVHGGLVSGTASSRRKIGMNRPNRQWDYPFGWAPQQILAWTGFLRYGFEEEAQRLAYRWIYMCTKAFSDFNGVVVEKYNVTEQIKPHKVTAEYGNQGSDFKGAPTEGFGWVNASYVYGLQIVNVHMKRCLGVLAPWDVYKKMIEAANVKEAQDILERHHKHEQNEREAEKVHAAEHTHHPALPHSHEDEFGHKAVHGTDERKEHKAPEDVEH